MPTHILVIEDNTANLDLMKYLLEAFGYLVRTAQDGAEGLEAIRAHSPDLVVCDVHLPNINGYEVARSMKHDAAMKDVPLVAVTALAMLGDREKVLAAGFDGYITKPVTPELFVGQVEKFLRAEQRSQTSPKIHRDLPPVAHEPFASHRATILFVDDVEINIHLMRTILEPQGYRVNWAVSVADGIQAWQQTNPDLIIIDIHLPDGTGFDLVRNIKGAGLWQDKPVLFLSGSTDSKDHERVREAGARKLLARPLEPEILLAEVAEALNRLERI
jgi:two-component system cell cycle response regulator